MYGEQMRLQVQSKLFGYLVQTDIVQLQFSLWDLYDSFVIDNVRKCRIFSYTRHLIRLRFCSLDSSCSV